MVTYIHYFELEVRLSIMMEEAAHLKVDRK
jgi:hypothetical protein